MCLIDAALINEICNYILPLVTFFWFDDSPNHNTMNCYKPVFIVFS